jgi:hypothetical protein
MSSANGMDPKIRIRVTPEPSAEELAAIVAALRARRRVVVENRGVDNPSSSGRWGRTGRREAMDNRDLCEGRDR